MSEFVFPLGFSLSFEKNKKKKKKKNSLCLFAVYTSLSLPTYFTFKFRLMEKSFIGKPPYKFKT